MVKKWLVVAISGVTCGGKTTLATQLNNEIPSSTLISQDDYFLPVEDERHVWIPELNHINFDILTSLDMKKMHEDILDVLSDPKMGVVKTATLSAQQLQAQKILEENRVKLLILEGFCILNYPEIERLCDIKYFLTLNREECAARRIQRVYEPPDCPGYFEKCAWPEYLNQLKDVRENVANVTFMNEGTREPLKTVLNDIINYFS